jgi:heterodisulfide reductase subunit A
VESALHLKGLNPEMNVYILYRDMRTYGEREYLYQKAREGGVIFIRYSAGRKPEVSNDSGRLQISAWDPVLQETVQIHSDMLVLACAIVPYGDQLLAQFFKIPMNEDGFFVEAHAKLGPSEFATDGVFLCGNAHYPKSLEEAVAQGQAASSRAVTLLAQKRIAASGTVAQVNPFFCSSCGVCVEVCPYGAPAFLREGPLAGKVDINPVLCKGCGLCAASCRSGAINLKGFGTDQILAMINEM